MNNTKPGMADYMLAVMNQILGSAAVEKEVSETEKVRIREINEVTVTERYMTIREWEMLGGTLGVLAMCLCIAAGRADEE